MRCAEEAGFERVVGVESSQTFVEQAAVFQRRLPDSSFTVVRGAVGYGLDVTDLPLVDVVLLANAHYYFEIPAFMDVLDLLRHRARYLIIVSAEVRHLDGHPDGGLPATRGYCREWIESGMVARIPTDGDPAPRRHMYGVRLQGTLQAADVGLLYRHWITTNGRSKTHPRWRMLAEALPALIGSGDAAPIERYLRMYHPKMADHERADYISRKRRLRDDMARRGQLRPIYLDARYNIADGLTRLVSAYCLNWRRIYARNT